MRAPHTMTALLCFFLIPACEPKPAASTLDALTAPERDARAADAEPSDLAPDVRPGGDARLSADARAPADVAVPTDVSRPVDVPAREDGQVDLPDLSVAADAAADAAVDAPIDSSIDQAIDAAVSVDGPLPPPPLCGAVNLPPLDPSACGSALCGDGLVSTCEVCRADCEPGRPGPFPMDCCELLSEVCDPRDPNLPTCVEQGFGGGQSACTDACDFDTRRCDGCGAHERLEACVRPLLPGTSAHSLSLSTSGDVVLIAYLADRDVAGTSNVFLARFDVDLRLIETLPCQIAVNGGRLSLAPSPGGFLLAYEHDAAVYLMPLDATGRARGPSQRAGDGTIPRLIERPNQPPLLLNQRGNDAYATVVDADGVAGASNPALRDVVELEYGSGVFTGDDFMIAQRTNAGIEVVPVSVDGVIGQGVTPVGQSVEYPQLALVDGGLRMTYSDFGAPVPGLYFASLNAAGQRQGESVELGSIPEYFNPAPVYGSGTETFVLVGLYSGTTGHGRQLESLRLDARGLSAEGPARLTIEGGLVTDYQLRPLAGPMVAGQMVAGQMVAAWRAGGSSGRIQLARFTP